MNVERDHLKIEAARRGVEYIEDGMVVGLGSGSTATHAIRLLGERIRAGLKVRGIPTSADSAGLARSLGIEIIGFEQSPEIDLTIDGADEILVQAGGRIDLIKGGGGKLLHEKIVALSSRRMVIIADETKLVEHLGRFPLPIEVIPFAAIPVRKRLERMGANPQTRMDRAGRPYTTDEGNLLFDCAFGQIDDPAALAIELKKIPGLVEHGLFLGAASVAVIAGPAGVRLIQP